MVRKLGVGKGVDFAERVEDALDRQFGSMILAPFGGSLPMPGNLSTPASVNLPAPSMLMDTGFGLDRIYQTRTYTEIPSITRRATFRTQRIDRFPNGHEVEQTWEASFEERSEVYRSMRENLLLSGNSVLERLLSEY